MDFSQVIEFRYGVIQITDRINVLHWLQAAHPVPKAISVGECRASRGGGSDGDSGGRGGGRFGPKLM